jgi:4-amino-4-deoxy-L-arabinose transferase-like glycosyltransferase
VYLWFAREVLRNEIGHTTLTVLLGCSLLLRLAFVTVTPIASDDFYRYLWDGKVQAHGFNPYQYAPSAAELAPLHTADLPARVNHPDMKTSYFPFTEWLFLMAYLLGGETIWALKLLLFLAEAGTVAALLALVGRLGTPRRFVLLYALCPLPVLQFAVDAHLDGFGLPLLIVSLVLHIKGRKTAALVLLGLSLSVKPVGLVLLPILAMLETRWMYRIRPILLPVLVVAVQYIPYVFTANPFESLLTFAEHWMFNGMVFSLLYQYFADNQVTRQWCAALLAVVLSVLYLSRGKWIVKMKRAILALLLFSPVVHAWYVTWLAVVLPAVPHWSGLVFVATVSLTAFTTMHYGLTGEWREFPAVMVGEYLPVVIVLLVAALRRKRAGSLSEEQR